MFKLYNLITGLSIDYVDNKLYWISSGNGTINRCNLDGGNLEVIESMKEELTKATALTIMGKCSGSIAKMLCIGCELIHYELLKAQKSYYSINISKALKLHISMSFFYFFLPFFNLSKQTCEIIHIRDFMLLVDTNFTVTDSWLSVICTISQLFFVFDCSVLKCKVLVYVSQ